MHSPARKANGKAPASKLIAKRDVFTANNKTFIII